VITVDFDRLAIEPGLRILDVGCGSGRHVCAASRFRDVVAIGADIQFDDAREARDRLRQIEQLGEGGGGESLTLRADIHCLPFGNDVFDLVICSEVLEHVHDPHAAVSEVVRVLKQGGNLVVSVPRYLPERICWELSDDYHHANDGHLRIYRKTELTALLEAAGVKAWASHFAHSLHTPYWWLKCLVGPTREDCRTVNLYHRFLVWDMMKHNPFTRFLDTMLNPVIGKSAVIYCRKE
jgi:SAM-dependent methyltransferase